MWAASCFAPSARDLSVVSGQLSVVPGRSGAWQPTTGNEQLTKDRTMSRIGKKPVPVGKAKVTLKEQHVTVQGPKGTLEIDVHPLIKVAQQEGNLVVTRPDDE